ncbi:hypothetical protein GIY62_06895 [Burkholderia plantarii]|nr:hypothetical protein [Burkholderia plantarii]WLE60373.1 hypothetical protein GIY62_06895 [Burkholderia plantarii]
MNDVAAARSVTPLDTGVTVRHAAAVVVGRGRARGSEPARSASRSTA